MSYPIDSDYLILNTTAQVVTSAGDISGAILTAAMPIEIVSWGMIITTAWVSNAAVKLALDKRIAAGSDTGRVDDVSTLTTGATVTAALFPIGNVVRCRQEAGSGAYVGPAPAEATFALLPGQQAVMEVDTAAAGGGNAGGGLPFIEYRRLPRADRASTIELIVSA